MGIKILGALLAMGLLISVTACSSTITTTQYLSQTIIVTTTVSPSIFPTTLSAQEQQAANAELGFVRTAVAAYMAANSGKVPTNVEMAADYYNDPLHGVYSIDSTGKVTQLAYYP